MIRKDAGEEEALTVGGHEAGREGLEDAAARETRVS